MSSISNFLLSLAVTLVAVTATPLERRETVGSDKIVGLPAAVPDGIVGDVYKAYQPFLKIINGCVPFPAVDAQGRTNGGLKPTGKTNGGCESSTGQTYVRGATHGDYYGIIYTWYMPKDSPLTSLGHRHDFEGTTIWLRDPSSTTAANIVAVCPSAHGGWDCSTNGYTLSGTSPLIKYESIPPINHACGLTGEVGGKQPLVAWESMSTTVRLALENADFGSANVPFIDKNFEGNLEKATF